MKRVLFVDDEKEVLSGLRVGLRKYRSEWDMVFAQGAEAGLATLAAAPCDVVVSDMRMPGMDGAAFLRIVMERYPQTTRIVLSGYADRGAVLRALGVAHQFLSKPFPSEELVEVLRRACALQQLVDDERLRGFMSRLSCLPSVRTVCESLTATIANPAATHTDLLRIVEQDCSLSAKLIQIVNSGSLVTKEPVATVEEALTALGADTVRTLLLSSSLVQSTEEVPPEVGATLAKLQQHAQLSARIARRLVVEPELQKRAFTTALLADAGRLVLCMCWPEAFARVTDQVEAGAAPVDAERAILGFTHAEVGAYLLGLWGLPQPIGEAVAFHHRPMELPAKGLDLVVVVHAAGALAAELLAARAATVAREALDLDGLARLGLADQVASWRQIAAEEARLDA